MVVLVRKRIPILTREHVVIYTTIGELSSKCEEFLAERSQVDSDHGFDFFAHTCCQSATLGPLFAFYCPLFFREKNNEQCMSRCMRESA